MHSQAQGLLCFQWSTSKVCVALVSAICICTQRPWEERSSLIHPMLEVSAYTAPSLWFRILYSIVAYNISIIYYITLRHMSSLTCLACLSRLHHLGYPRRFPAQCPGQWTRSDFKGNHPFGEENSCIYILLRSHNSHNSSWDDFFANSFSVFRPSSSPVLLWSSQYGGKAEPTCWLQNHSNFTPHLVLLVKYRVSCRRHE